MKNLLLVLVVVGAIILGVGAVAYYTDAGCPGSAPIME